VSAVCCKDYGSLDFSQRAPAISLVDDDRLVREAIERFIRSLGYNIDVFASAEDFLAKISGSIAAATFDIACRRM
jgi:FixJ family two-component response regulator